MITYSGNFLKLLGMTTSLEIPPGKQKKYQKLLDTVILYFFLLNIKIEGLNGPNFQNFLPSQPW